MSKLISKIVVPDSSEATGYALYNVKDANAIPASEKGVASGVATLDSSGKVPSSQLPSYADDIIEGYYHDNKFYATYTPGEEEQEGTYSDEITPELGKIYVDLESNEIYRWSGSEYIIISSLLVVQTIGNSTTAVISQKGITDVITENEEIVSAALNDLNNRVEDLEENPYVLPTASAQVLGGVKVGNNLSIDNNGVLSADAAAIEIVQTTGSSTTAVMSLNAVTNELLSKTTTYIGVCDTEPNVLNKEVTISNANFILSVGCVVGVKYTNTNTASVTSEDKITLNVNNTGAKHIYYNNQADPEGVLPIVYGEANKYIYYMYDGTYWVWQGVDYVIDTKNTTGASATLSKIYIVGAESQQAEAQTHSQSTAYVGTDGCLYSDGQKVLTSHQDISGKADVSDLQDLETAIKYNNVLGTTISSSERTAWNAKVDSSFVGAANGVASLDANGKVPSTQLPSYVDDVIEGYYHDGKFYENYTEGAGHNYVEIGGIKWATMNIGAESITDGGLYFQWGDTQGYTASQVGSGEGQKAFGWNDYKYGSSSPFSKYDTDGKTVLDAEDDAVAAAWGGNWRMPTKAEFQAFGDAVNTAWTNDYQSTGVKGLVCTSKADGATLFFPATGFAHDGSVNNVGSYGGYWSSSLYADYVYSAYQLHFSSDYTYYNSSSVRCYGSTVRGIYTGNLPSGGGYSGEITPESGKIYVDLSSNKTYRWGSSQYTEISESLAIGTTAGTACEGNDSRLSDSRPASDVYAWAKAATKPTYTLSEVGSISNVVQVSSNLNNQVAPESITGSGNDGKMAHVLYVNDGGADYTIVVSTASGYITPDGNGITLTCPQNGYCELSYLNISGTIYVRGL